MALNEEEQKVHKEAVEFAKKNKKDLAKKLTDRDIYIVEESPVSVFMAGSPGAGKTEASKALLEEFDSKIIRLDIDNLRDLIPGYQGGNAHLFQGGANILLEKGNCSKFVGDFAGQSATVQ